MKAAPLDQTCTEQTRKSSARERTPYTQGQGETNISLPNRALIISNGFNNFPLVAAEIRLILRHEPHVAAKTPKVEGVLQRAAPIFYGGRTITECRHFGEHIDHLKDIPVSLLGVGLA